MDYAQEELFESDADSVILVVFVVSPDWFESVVTVCACSDLLFRIDDLKPAIAILIRHSWAWKQIIASLGLTLIATVTEQARLYKLKEVLWCKQACLSYVIR